MNIYFDTCALNRLTDDQTQDRVRNEAEAVSLILDKISAGEMKWFASDVLARELSRNPEAFLRSITSSFLSLASASLATTPRIATRASRLETSGFGQFDALHLAHAEAAKIDVLFTVDDRFLKRAATLQLEHPKLQIANPLEWVRRRSVWLVKP